MKDIISWFVKGFGIGAANVIPGVSGGTIALLTGVFERLVDSLKSFDIKAIKLFFSGKFKSFFEHTDFLFLATLLLGAVASIFTFARLLSFLFENYEVYVWAYFFGLILVSVYYVLKEPDSYDYKTIISFILGAGVAIAISFLNPATENDAVWYLVICGMVGVMSMILPGLSGSFVLILMGNYQLVMIDSVNEFNLEVLIPVGIGVVIALPLFSKALSWVFKRYRNQTIAVLAGFILGSLRVLWPWKETILLKDENGIEKLKQSGKPIVEKYIQYLPETITEEVIIAFALMLTGVLSVWLIQKFASSAKQKTENADY